MSEMKSDLRRYFDRFPEPEAIRRELTATLRQEKLLRQLLRLAEQRRLVEEAKTCG